MKHRLAATLLAATAALLFTSATAASAATHHTPRHVIAGPGSTCDNNGNGPCLRPFSKTITANQEVTVHGAGYQISVPSLLRKVSATWPFTDHALDRRTRGDTIQYASWWATRHDKHPLCTAAPTGGFFVESKVCAGAKDQMWVKHDGYRITVAASDKYRAMYVLTDAGGVAKIACAGCTKAKYQKWVDNVQNQGNRIPPALALTAARAAPVGKTLHAATAVSDRPDSGAQGGDWADDTMTRAATITYLGAADTTNCGGAPACYHFRGNIRDSGHSQTIPGALSPGFGDLNGGADPTLAGAITGTMTGEYHYNFYTTTRYITASRVPRSENDNGATPTGRQASCLWLAQFFGPGTHFWQAGADQTAGGCIGTSGSWVYTFAPGAGTACPNVSSQWVDASPDWGSLPADGNVLAPDASHC